VCAAWNCGKLGSMPRGRLNWKPWPTIGSGKLGTPWDRMHAAYWSAASCSAAEGPPPVPWGNSVSHALTAAWYPGASLSTPAGNCPPGSGKVETPCDRMHWANANAPVLPAEEGLALLTCATDGTVDPLEQADARRRGATRATTQVPGPARLTARSSSGNPSGLPRAAPIDTP
jgi:hypothetical protein